CQHEIAPRFRMGRLLVLWLDSRSTSPQGLTTDGHALTPIGILQLCWYLPERGQFLHQESDSFSAGSFSPDILSASRRTFAAMSSNFRAIFSRDFASVVPPFAISSYVGIMFAPFQSSEKRIAAL